MRDVLLHELALDPSAAPESAPALVTSSETWTRGHLRRTVADLAGAAATLVPPGGRIALVADSRPEVVALLLGAPAAGRVVVPINVRLTPEEIADQIARTGAGAVIGTDDELDRLDPALPHGPGAPTTVGLDPGSGDVSIESLVAAPEVLGPTPVPELDDPAWIIATSGTTGRPKGAVLTARSLGAAIATTAAARPLADDDVYLYPFPLYHVSAYNVLHALSRGRPVVLPRRFDAGGIVEMADRHRVTTMSLAPTMLRILLDHRVAQPEPGPFLAGLRTIAYGAAPLPASLLAEASEVLGVGFAQGYGMTELSGNAVFLGPDDHARGLAGEERLLRAAGWPGPGVELKVADEHGRSQPAGEPGEIWVSGDQVCAGYWDDPEATADTICDGWLRTGDVGVLDEDGLLTIVDRAKDVIVTGGENVASREVEDVLGHHPLVSRVAVVGVPDDRWGEAVWAAVVLRPDAGDDGAVDPAALVAWARQRMAPFKAPKNVVVVDDLPVNAGGKVVKDEVRRRLAEGR